MESLCALIKSRFKKHWRMIGSQIHAVNADKNPKRAFLFDCGAVDVEKIVDVVTELKAQNLISKDISIVIVKEDVFILNIRKFLRENCHVSVDISGRLEKPRVVEDAGRNNEMFSDIDMQIKAGRDESLFELSISDDWCIPTVFGYLIGYPVLYCQDDDNNCLGFIDLKVFRVIARDETLISFSVPLELYVTNKDIRDKVTAWLKFFQYQPEYETKSLTVNYPTVIL